jgi:predicted RNA-binding Zn-ribbon protein involved in translation (DUF1610 family)
MTDFEVVVWNLADRIKLFLKYFEWMINHLGLYEVFKIGMSEWDLMRYWGSERGRLSITPIGNNIVCRVRIRDDYHNPPVEPLVRNAIEYARRMVIAESPEPTPPKTIPPNSVKTKLGDCPACGKALHWELDSCPFCGSKLEKCIVCNLIIGENDEITKCPYCSGLAHRDHMLEYIKVKGQCPSCGKELKQL